MRLIGENIHIISKKTKTAIENKDSAYILDMAKKQAAAGVEWIDLNIGPAKKGWEGTMDWLSTIILNEMKINLSYDTSNMAEIEAGLKTHSNPENCL
ncbi:MAG: dihydropteroate synthase, partial [bacterium]